MPVGRRRAALVATLVALLALAGCTNDDATQRPTPTPSTASPTPTPTPTPTQVSAQVGAPDEAATVLPAATPQDAALEASRALFETAPIAVVAPVEDVVGVGIGGATGTVPATTSTAGRGDARARTAAAS